MVSFNVSQLLLMGPGAIREFDFSESLSDPEQDLPLRGPVRGYTRLTRTSEGILAHTEYRADVTLECARCLEEAETEVEGDFDEEFLPSVDIRTGTALELNVADDQPLIDEHHEIVLDEVLRQNILTNLPLRPLCEPACPGLCSTCGERLTAQHRTHPELEDEHEPEAPVDPASPFARLAVLLHNDQER